MPETSLELLREAISQRAGAVISLPANGAIQHFKTRFIGPRDDSFSVEPVPADPTVVETLIAQNSNIGLAFRSGPAKVIFTSQLRPIPAEMAASVLLVRYPSEVHMVQRRSSYRVAVGDDGEVEVRVWRIADHAILRDRPSAALEMGAKLVDLSVGGLGLHLEVSGDPLAVEQRLRILLHFGEIEALLDGRARHVRPSADGSQRVGVQFKKLENDLEGRQTQTRLATIVAHLQRQEILRNRLKEETQTLKLQAG
jgi:c-di-GMP-binding flagellar brake protein YcgR